LIGEEVEAAIEEQVRREADGAEVGDSIEGSVDINGKEIRYRGQVLEGGRIHIGTYFPPKRK
jgi:hypothetical protein